MLYTSDVKVYSLYYAVGSDFQGVSSLRKCALVVKHDSFSFVVSWFSSSPPPAAVAPFIVTGGRFVRKMCRCG